MKSSAAIAWLGILVTATIAYGSWRFFKHEPQSVEVVPTAAPQQASLPTDLPKLKSFELTDQLGHKFDSKSLAGKIWVGSFFFANCPGPCWRLNQALSWVDAEYGPKGVQFVSITCDPKNDSPEALKRYADKLQADPARWHFLTGDLGYIMRIGFDMFMLPVAEGTHSEKAVVFDETGKVRGLFNLQYPEQVEKIRKLLNELVAEKKSSAAKEKDDKPSTEKGEASKRS